MNHYDVLGVTRSASEEDIKKAWKQKAFELHPDRAPGKESEFRRASEAYEVLGNTEKRRSYDNSLPNARRQGFYNPPPDPSPEEQQAMDDAFDEFFNQHIKGKKSHEWKPNPKAKEDGWTGSDIPEDFFGASGGRSKYGDVYESAKKSGFRPIPQPIQTLHLPLSTFLNGGRVKRKMDLNGIECEYDVVIPAGSQVNSILQAKNPVKQVDRFELKLDVPGYEYDSGTGNFKSSMNVSIIKLMVGGSLKVTLPSGETRKLKVGSGIDRLREGKPVHTKIAEQGAYAKINTSGPPDLDAKRGDVFITLNPTIPASLSEKQIQLLKEFDKLQDEKET